MHDLAGDLGRNEDEISALIDRGPFLTPRRYARSSWRPRPTVATSRARPKTCSVRAPACSIRGPRESDPSFGPTGQIGVVVIDGTIVDGENVDVPFVDVHLSGGRTVVEAIDKFTDDTRIRAIVLRIDSPGGAVMASDQIWRAVKRARAKKPVVASMGGVAASGGYYAAAAAR